MHYILSREKIEHFASEVLKEYNAEYLEIPQAIDVYDFMENFMGLETDYKNLSPDESVLGLTAFNDGIYMVWNEDRTKQYPIEVLDGRQSLPGLPTGRGLTPTQIRHNSENLKVVEPKPSK